MADNEVKVRISGQDDLSPTMQKAIENMANLHTEAINLNTGLELLEKGAEIAKEGFEILKEVVAKSIEEALEAEKANTRLSGALIATGQYSGETAEELDKYTEALERNTGANGEAVKGMIATALNLGLTVDKAKEMEQAARQLAAATGGTVEEAFSKLQASLAGNARGLGQVIPQVKELGAAQLKTGEAIDIVIKATAAQYAQYQESLPAAIQKATGAYNDLYKAFGQAITASPALQSVISSLATSFRDLGAFIEKNKGQITTFVSDGVLVAVDALQILQNTIDVLYRTGDAAFNSLAAVINGAFAAISKSLSVVLQGLSYLPGAAGKAAKEGADALKAMYEVTWAATKQNADNVVNAVQNQTQASKTLTDVLQGTKEAAEGALKAHDGNADAMKRASEAANAYNKANLALTQSFAGINIGNEASRKQLAAQSEDYKKSLGDFQQFYDTKIQIAVTKEAFQASEIAKVRAASLKGTGGEQEKTANADAAVTAETVKQQQLAAKRDMGILNEAQYEEALLTSQRASQQASLDMANAHANALADALGESPAGFQLKQQVIQQNFAVEEQLKQQRAIQSGATQAQIDSMAQQDEDARLAQSVSAQEEYYNKQAAMEEQAGNHYLAYLARVHAAQVKQGTVMGALTTATQSAEFKSVESSLNNISTLRNTHSKAAFEIGKAAAIAGAIVNTAQGAIAALAPPPLGVGPLFGGILAGTVIAAGAVQIASIASQEFPGGQADQGMDSIPSSLAGKSFVLSAGERVVQPEANAKLTAFLDRNVGNGTTLNGQAPVAGSNNAPTTINITVTPGVTQADAQKAVDTMIGELRKASERGQPIINEKGIVYNNSR